MVTARPSRILRWLAAIISGGLHCQCKLQQAVFSKYFVVPECVAAYSLVTAQVFRSRVQGSQTSKPQPLPDPTIPYNTCNAWSLANTCQQIFNNMGLHNALQLKKRYVICNCLAGVQAVPTTNRTQLGHRHCHSTIYQLPQNHPYVENDCQLQLLLLREPCTPCLGVA